MTHYNVKEIIEATSFLKNRMMVINPLDAHVILPCVCETEIEIHVSSECRRGVVYVVNKENYEFNKQNNKNKGV